jgi:hypothetical protein
MPHEIILDKVFSGNCKSLATIFPDQLDQTTLASVRRIKIRGEVFAGSVVYDTARS